MVKIIEINYHAVYEKRNQKEYFANEIGYDLNYRNGTPCDKLSSNVIEIFNLENTESVIFPILAPKLLLVEPFKGRKCNNGDVHLSVLTKENKDLRWIQIKSKDIIEMSYDQQSCILMVTTFKRSRKIFYLFFLKKSLNDLSEFWEIKHHPRKFLFEDFAKREHLTLNMDKLLTFKPSTPYEECLKLFILFVQENPSVTPDSFKQMLSEPGGMKRIIRFNPSAHEHILKWGRYRCVTCWKWCEMRCACGFVRYCDIECQKSDWTRHQKECEGFFKRVEESNKIDACFEKYLQDRMKTSIDLTVQKFYKRLRRKVYHDDFNSRAIEYFPEESSMKSLNLDDVD